MIETQTTMQAVETLTLVLAPYYTGAQNQKLEKAYLESARRRTLGRSTLLECYLAELLTEYGTESHPFENPTITFGTHTEKETHFINALHAGLIRCFETDGTTPIEVVFNVFSGENSKPYMLQTAEAFNHCKSGTASEIESGDFPKTWTIAIVAGEATIADEDGNYGDTQSAFYELQRLCDDLHDRERTIVSALLSAFRIWRNKLHQEAGIAANLNKYCGIGPRITLDVLAHLMAIDPTVRTKCAFSSDEDYSLIGIQLPSARYNVFAIGQEGHINLLNVDCLGPEPNVDFDDIRSTPFSGNRKWQIFDLREETSYQKIVEEIATIILTSRN